MMKCLKNELKYVFYSKVFVCFLLALTVIYGLVVFANYTFVNEANLEYDRVLEYASHNGTDIESELNKEFSIVTSHEGVFTSSGVINNPLAYYHDQLKKLFFAASPEYTLVQMSEVSFILILPLLFGLIGAFLGSYDLSQKTIKLKGVRFSRLSLGLSKHLTLLIITSAIYIIALVIAKVMGIFMFSQLYPTMDPSYFSSLTQNGNLLLKLVFAYLIGFLFAEIALNLSIISKRAVVGIVALFTYLLLVPNLGRFELKNAIHFLASKVYDFYGIASVGEFTPNTTVLGSVITLAAISILFVAAGALTLNRRSLYE